MRSVLGLLLAVLCGVPVLRCSKAGSGAADAGAAAGAVPDAASPVAVLDGGGGDAGDGGADSGDGGDLASLDPVERCRLARAAAREQWEAIRKAAAKDFQKKDEEAQEAFRTFRSRFVQAEMHPSDPEVRRHQALMAKLRAAKDKAFAFMQALERVPQAMTGPAARAGAAARAAAAASPSFPGVAEARLAADAIETACQTDGGP